VETVGEKIASTRKYNQFLCQQGCNPLHDKENPHFVGNLEKLGFGPFIKGACENFNPQDWPARCVTSEQITNVASLLHRSEYIKVTKQEDNAADGRFPIFWRVAENAQM
jgi:hypothetical protein